MAEAPRIPYPSRYTYRASSDTLGAQIHTRNARHVAPDALVYINRERVFKSSGGGRGPYFNEITDLNISLNIDSSPGSASFTLVVPDHMSNKYFNRGYFFINLMSEVHIFIKGRFPVQKGTEVEYPYYQCFWGVVSAVQEARDATGNVRLTIECMDILRIWQLSNITLRSSLASAHAGVASSPQVNVFAHKFVSKDIFSCIATLASMVGGEVTAPESYFIGGDKNKADRAVDRYEISGLHNMATYWESRFNQIGAALKIFGFDGTCIEQGVAEGNFISIKNRDSTYKRLYDNMKLYISNIPTALKELNPYYLIEFPEFSLMQSDNTNILDMAKEIAQIGGFEFYMDTTGDIVFKPPFYNLNCKRFMPYVIEDIELISEQYTEDESEIITCADFNGALIQYGGGSGEFVQARSHNYHLSREFLLRVMKGQMDSISNPKALNAYAQAALAQHNARVASTGSVSIIGRPEMRLGMPIFLPRRDMFYYIQGITHSFTFGESFTTSLSLIAGRKRRYGLVNGDNENFSEENISKNVWMLKTGTLEDIIKEDEEAYKALHPEKLDPKKIPKGVTQANLSPIIDATTINDPISGIFKSEFEIKFSMLSSVTPEGRWEYEQVTSIDRAKQIIQTTDPDNKDVKTNQKITAFQVTDLEGYEVFGGYSIGQGIYLDENGNVEFKSPENPELLNDANYSFNLKPSYDANEIIPENKISTLPNSVLNSGVIDNNSKVGNSTYKAIGMQQLQLSEITASPSSTGTQDPTQFGNTFIPNENDLDRYVESNMKWGFTPHATNSPSLSKEQEKEIALRIKGRAGSFTIKKP